MEEILQVLVGQYQKIITRLEKIENQNQEILSCIQTDEVLNLSQIKRMLNFSSYDAFRSRITELKKYGLKKDGVWKMKRSELNMYLESKRIEGK